MSMIALSDSKFKVNEKHGKCLLIDFWTVYPRRNQDQDLVDVNTYMLGNFSMYF